MGEKSVRFCGASVIIWSRLQRSRAIYASVCPLFGARWCAWVRAIVHLQHCQCQEAHVSSSRWLSLFACSDAPLVRLFVDWTVKQ